MDHLDSTAATQEGRINDSIERTFERSDGISSRTQLRLSLATYIMDGNIEDKMLVKKILNDALNSIDDFKRISIVDNDRKVLVSTEDSIEGQYYSEEYPAANLTAKHLSLVQDETGNLVIRSTAPLVLNGSVLGVVVVDAEHDIITDITRDYTGLGSTGETILVKQDPNGDVLFLTPLRFEPNTTLEKRMNNDGTKFAIPQMLLKKEATFSDIIDYRGEPVLAATRFIETTGWSLIAKIDKAEMFAPVANLIYSTGTILAITIPVVTVVAISTTRLLSYPIKQLKDAAAEIAKGHFDTEIKSMTSDEIGELAAQFDYMRRSVKDREELKLQAEKLREIDKAKEEFSAMISHELKTPLVPIQGYCEMLLGGMYGELTPKQKEKIEVMRRNSLSLLHLIQDILDVHKLEMGKMKFDTYDVSAKELTDLCIDAFKPTANAKNITMVARVDQGLGLKCDPERIQQVLKNLVDNALRFVPEQTGIIEVSARRDNDSILFSVKDNGIGIPKDKQKDLFKKFYQVDTSLRRKTGGTGLGLAICKGIVQAHNGKIWVESEEGKGSTFYFTIPAGD